MVQATPSKPIILCAHDPGGANQMVAVYDLLQGDSDFANSERKTATDLLSHLGLAGDIECFPFGAGPSVAVWEQAGIHPASFPTFQGDVAGDERSRTMEALCQRVGAMAIITEAPSAPESGFFELWETARRMTVPTMVFLDHNVNVVERFFDRDGELKFPDHIYILDSASKNALVAAGMRSGGLYIHPNLHLSRIVMQAGDSASSRQELRNVWGIGDEDCVVLFASECATEMVALGYERFMDEHAVVDRLIATVASGGPLGPYAVDPAATRIVIRPHPRDTAGKYDRYIDDERCGLVVSGAGDPRSAILAADVVVGVSSMLLEEARALGRPVVRLDGALR